ncbi:MAG: hypothetical protein HYZ92_07105 [Candidatus Omnitrophica bacterium]|nr:hypothetical protein [Candidatus Omnitrophota bacterium]
MSRRRVFAKWLLFIAAMTGIGMIRVAQQTAIYLKSYEIGRRVAAIHELDNQTRWLQTQVMELRAPEHLTDVMQRQRLELVAWSTADDGESDATRAGERLGD